ncbi:MAG: alpha/beta hydrolase [Alistipes sp.]
MKDAQTALKLVRQKAADWHVDPNRVGIMGFSAGGHLAATAATHFTGPEDRPDFSILIYPVISMDSITHQGSKDNLLGTNAPAELAERYSNEKQVTDQTPRAFIALSDDDNGVPPANSDGYSALKSTTPGRTARLSGAADTDGLARFVRIPRRTARFARPLARRDPQIRIAESPLR